MTEINKAIAYYSKRVELENGRVSEFANSTDPELKAAASIYKQEAARHSIVLYALLEAEDREDPKPLTLEELRERDGKPVYVVCGDSKNDINGWHIVSLEECGEDEDGNPADGVTVYSPVLFGERPEEAFYGMKCDMECDGMQCQHGLHQMGWLAYDYEPKEVQGNAD